MALSPAIFRYYLQNGPKVVRKYAAKELKFGTTSGYLARLPLALKVR